MYSKSSNQYAVELKYLLSIYNFWNRKSTFYLNSYCYKISPKKKKNRRHNCCIESFLPNFVILWSFLFSRMERSFNLIVCRRKKSTHWMLFWHWQSLSHKAYHQTFCYNHLACIHIKHVFAKIHEIEFLYK